MPKNYVAKPITEPDKMPTYKPTLYFFYGTLTQSEMLRHVLDISKDQRVTLRPTEIIGCSFTNWGQYRALIDGERKKACTCPFALQYICMPLSPSRIASPVTFVALSCAGVGGKGRG